MVEIDLDRFSDDVEFKSWLLTEPGKNLFDQLFITITASIEKGNRHIPVITKKYDGTVYSFDMKNIRAFCNIAIQYYETFEEYEKCDILVKLNTNYV
jgi:hypothetical protein